MGIVCFERNVLKYATVFQGKDKVLQFVDGDLSEPVFRFCNLLVENPVGMNLSIHFKHLQTVRQSDYGPVILASVRGHGMAADLIGVLCCEGPADLFPEPLSGALIC